MRDVIAPGRIARRPRARGVPSSGALMSDVKGRVALMMKLPKAERLNQLVAMSQECISRGEDAAPLLELIQMEMDDWETASNASSVASSRPASVASSAAIRPASSTSSAAADPKEKSMRRQLTEKRNELRTMLAQVNAALGEAPSAPSSRGATPSSQQGPKKASGPDAGGSGRLSQAEIDALLRKAEGGKAPGECNARSRSSVASIL